MILYHGSNSDIETIDLARGLRHKDFGKGFYLTPDKATATRMAQKKARLFGGLATLITYDMDDSALQSDLIVKVFPENPRTGSPTAARQISGPAILFRNGTGSALPSQNRR